jgi:CRP-like cAMP-binding protein
MPFCLIQEGSVATTSTGNLGPGGSFGEDILENKGHVAKSVTALTDGVAYTIDRPSFEKVFGDMSQLAQKSNDKKILRDLRAIRAAKVDGPILDLLARQIANEPFIEGEEFCAINEDMVPKLYIVREGSVKIIRKNGKEDIIEAGGFFGHEYLMISSKGGRDSVPPHVKAKYCATAMEDGVCGVLTLQECVSVFGNDVSKTEELEEGRIIPLDNLEHYRVLGEGHFGVVWLVADKKAPKPEPYALKIQMLDDDERNAEECIREEITMMRKLQYPFIVRVINTYDAEESISMLLGLAPGGELFDQIHYQLPNGLWDSGIGEEKGRFYSSVVADALAFMHIRGFIYRDLKPENVLIDQEGYPLITDFGFTRHLKKDELAYTMCGTPNYLPPEIIKNLGHAAPADNWSLAVLIYEVVQGESPFWYEGLDQVSLFHAICEEDYYPLPDEAISDELRDLIHRLLEKNPSKRLGTFREKDILNHPWFAPLDIRKIRKKEIKAPWVPDPIQLGEPFRKED